MGTANTWVVSTDLAGNIHKLTRLVTEPGWGREHLLEVVERKIDHALEENPTICGIGISRSGVIEQATGTVLFWSKVRGWNRVPLRHMLRSRYSLPVVVEGSVRIMALAGQCLGRARGVADAAYASVGMGIGSALFLNGHLYHGHRGLAGKLGHTTIDEGGDLCSCGNRSCLEVYASGSVLNNRIRSALEKGVSSSLLDPWQRDLSRFSVEAIVEAARAHDRFSGLVLVEAGTHIGTALAAPVNLLNPQRIILGDAIPRAAKGLLLKSLLQSLRARAFQNSLMHLEVTGARLADEAAALGAALPTAENILETLSSTGKHHAPR
jgi:predicted NBD/HSP70 family sugar kinase